MSEEIQFNPRPDPPAESTAQTLLNIFFEPGETFKALRVRPRFLIAGLIVIGLFMTYYFTFVARVGSEAIGRAAIEQRSPDATPEQIEQGLSIQRKPIVKAITYASIPLVFSGIFAAGAGLYLLGATLMGKSVSYKQALSVWVYSQYPPMFVFVVINILLLFLKPVDTIDPAAINNGISRSQSKLPHRSQSATFTGNHARCF